MGYFELGILLAASIGVALLAGTGAALWRYRRTGSFPSQPDGTGSAEALRAAKLRLALGTVLTLAGVLTVAGVLG